MGEITTIGLDLAKRTFHVVGCNAQGKEVKRKVLKRTKVQAYFANLPACVVGMEACASAHFWGRTLQELGHEVRLIPPQHVKAYVRGNKNDYNDARAIAEAAQRPDLRLVTVKTVEQQDVQALHRLREARVAERTALSNQVRGLLAEYGIVFAQGVRVLRQQLPELLEDGENGVSDFFRALLADCYRQLQEIDTHINFYTQTLKRHAQHNEAVQRVCKRHLDSAPSWSVCSRPSWAMARPFVKGATSRRPWAWCPNNTAAAAKPCCLGSASAVTATYAAS